MRLKLLGIFFTIGIVLWLLPPAAALACEQYQCDDKKDNEEEYLACIRDKKACLESKLSEVSQQKNSLNTTISVIAGKISLQEVTIKQTLADIGVLEREVDLLSQRIDTLDFSLDQLTNMLLARVRERYKQQMGHAPLLLQVEQGIGGATLSDRYVSQASAQTAQIMHLAESQRQLYDKQKEVKKLKQQELSEKQDLLESQKKELDSQKAAQQRLLQETKSSEAEYQRQLAAVLAEYQAIQAIISGSGKEEKAGDVKQGDTIASVIQGKSCNSSATHLHFMVTKNGVVQNPFTYLGSMDANNCSGSSCGSGDGDSFNPQGSWPWPISGPVTFNQGYGVTWAVRHTWVSRIYSSHNGIDVNGSSSTVKAVADGTLYRGKFSGSGSCALQYVKVEHADGLVSWYLHINY